MVIIAVIRRKNEYKYKFKSERVIKKVEAYINTLRVHWLIEELQKIGIAEIKVTQYFKSYSQISLLELKCDNNFVKEVRKLVHEIGTTGNAVDHYFTVKNLDSDEDFFHLNILN